MGTYLCDLIVKSYCAACSRIKHTGRLSTKTTKPIKSMLSIAFLLTFVPTVHAKLSFSPGSTLAARYSPTTARNVPLSTSLVVATATKLRGGEVQVSDVVDHSFGWATNLGAPAALVAGSVIGTLYENIRSGDLKLLETDTKLVKLGKKVTHTLLLTAFVLEIMCIFVTTVMGTVLLERPLDIMDDVSPITDQTTPLSFLRGNFEFEYLTARVTFLQGLFNWLTAIALAHALPTSDVGQKELRTMNRFIASTIFVSILLMLSFYNGHMTFYANYFVMLKRWYVVTFKNFLLRWPPRPMTLALLFAFGYTAYEAWNAFFDNDLFSKGKASLKDQINPQEASTAYAKPQ